MMRRFILFLVVLAAIGGGIYRFRATTVPLGPCEKQAGSWGFPTVEDLFDGKALDRQITVVVMSATAKGLPEGPDRTAIDDGLSKGITDAFSEFKRFQILISSKEFAQYQRSRERANELWGGVGPQGEDVIVKEFKQGLPFDYLIDVSVSFNDQVKLKTSGTQQEIIRADISAGFFEGRDPNGKIVFTIREWGGTTRTQAQGYDLAQANPFAFAAHKAARHLALKLQSTVPLYGSLTKVLGDGGIGTMVLLDAGRKHGIRPDECFLLFEEAGGQPGDAGAKSGNTIRLPVAHAVPIEVRGETSQLQIVELNSADRLVTVGQMGVALGIDLEQAIADERDSSQKNR